jgi:acetolactate synthase regulatory subunit
MSQRDLVAELQAARITAPTGVREHVRLIAAQDTASSGRRVTWRRALVVLVPVAAAVAATVVVAWPAHSPQRLSEQLATAKAAPAQGHAFRSLVIPPSARRVQQYGASLSLRVSGVSDAVKGALRIVSSFGGYPVSVHASTSQGAGSAELVLKVPRSHVQAAVAQLSKLGTIVAEQVDVQDLTAGLNASDRTIALLQRQLSQLRAQPQTDVVKRQIAAATARVVALQRDRAATIRTAHFATVQLSLSTLVTTQPKHHPHGPLHGLGVAFRWIGIGLVYALALGVPAGILLGLVWLGVRAVRRRRVDALLSRP